MEKPYYLMSFCEDWADEFNVPALDCRTEEDYLDWYNKDLWEGEELYTSLGNSGDGFIEKFEKYITGKDFVDNNIVKVTKVTKEFHDLFHKHGLSRLSLFSIFDI